MKNYDGLNFNVIDEMRYMLDIQNGSLFHLQLPYNIAVVGSSVAKNSVFWLDGQIARIDDIYGVSKECVYMSDMGETLHKIMINL